MLLSSWPYRVALLAIACIAMLPYASAAVEYCSDINTSTNSMNSSLYQSNGLCSDFCRADYAFGIVQSNGCWCSNYAPGTTEDGCTTPCPGYPLELCGGSGVYGYIALDNAVSGTVGATSSSTSTTTTTTEEQTSTTVAAAAQVTVTEVSEPTTIIPDPQTVTVTPSSEPSTTTTSSETTVEPVTTSTTPRTTSHTTTTSSSSSTSWTPTPVTSLETVTGQVRTVTVTPTTPPTAASSSSAQKSTSDGGLSTGAAVGLTIGLVALVALLGSIAYFCWRRRQKEKNAEYNNVSARQSGTGFTPVVPSRTMSESSRFVLNTDGHRVVESWEDGNTSKGRMVAVDQRLDPFSGVYQRPFDSKSRDSVNTIHDDHDYSRRVLPVLRATNPDPDS